MFGYVRPLKGELKINEFEAYKSVYCGLCHTLAERYGFFARFTVNYDFTFLAMLIRGADSPQLSRKRCPAPPFRKKQACRDGQSLDVAADLCVILYYWKIRDSISDEGFFKSTLYRVAALTLKNAYGRAAAFRPEFAETVSDKLSQLSALELENRDSMDAAADCFASLLAACSVYGAGDNDRRVLGQLLYHIGRFIYIADAANDLEEDVKHGRYNPLIGRFALTSGKLGTEAKDYILRTLKLSCVQVALAFELMDDGYYTPVLRNIISLGLPRAAEAVLSGEWNAEQKIKIRRENF